MPEILFFYILENKRAEQKKGKQEASQWLHAKSAVKLQRDNPWASIKVKVCESFMAVNTPIRPVPKIRK